MMERAHEMLTPFLDHRGRFPGRIAIVSVLLVGLAAVLTGCSGGSGGGGAVRVRDGDFVVGVRAWVVFDQNEDFSVPPNQRNGCRLQPDKIVSIMDDFIRDANAVPALYGSRVRFEFLNRGSWTTTSNPAAAYRTWTIIDPVLDFRDRDDSMGFNASILGSFLAARLSAATAPGSTPDAVDIYFAGHYPSANNPAPTTELLGTTAGPDFLINDFTRLFSQGFIIINDFTFSPTSTGFEPSDIERLNVVHHEMAHYLARFGSRTFGVAPGPRTYTAGEHPTSASWGRRSILFNMPTAPTGSLPRFIHGEDVWSSAPADEREEISDRIRDFRVEEP